MIRRMLLTDIPKCASIVRANWDEWSARSASLEFSRIGDNDAWSPIFYVFDNGDIRGVAGYCMSPVDCGAYDICWVEVEPLSQRKGIGKQLVRRCLWDIALVGHLALLSTAIPNYYLQFGFQVAFRHSGERYLMTVDLTCYKTTL